MHRYITRPIPIEAIQWTGSNGTELFNFCPQAHFEYDDNKPSLIHLYIHTPTGHMRAQLGDYIIHGINGEFYPCNKDIFEKNYMEVNE